MKRTFTFNNNNPKPFITLERTENYILTNKEEEGGRSTERIEYLVVTECYLKVGSEIADAVLQTLNEPHDGWNRIYLSNFDGDDTILHQIMQSNVTNIFIGGTTRRRWQQQINSIHHHSHLQNTGYWHAFCNVISSSSFHENCSSLTFYGLDFTCESVKMLSNAFDTDETSRQSTESGKNGNFNINHKNGYNIEGLTLYSVSFLNGSHIDLANTIRKYLSPSLQSFTLYTLRDIPDTELSKFLSPILLVEDYSMRTRSTTNTTAKESVSFPLEDLNLISIPKIGKQTLSVITKWLQPKASTAAVAARNPATDIVGKDGNDEYTQHDKDIKQSLPRDTSAMTTTSFPPQKHHHHHRKSLTMVPLSSNRLPLDDDLLNSLSQSKIESLKLKVFNELSEEEFTKLARTLYQCHRHLKVLDLSGWDLSKYSSSLIEQLLRSIAGSSTFYPGGEEKQNEGKQHPVLTRLNLAGCKLNDDFIRVLSNQFHNFTNLQTLNLSRNQFVFNKSIIQYLLPTMIEGTNQFKLLLHFDNLILDRPSCDIHYINQLQYVTDLNRSGGRRYLLLHQQPQQHQEQQSRQEKGGDYSIVRRRTAPYCYPRVTMWPYIFHRINYFMPLPPIDDDAEKYIDLVAMDKDSIIKSNTRRRSSIIYHLLLHGVIIDCLLESKLE